MKSFELPKVCAGQRWVVALEKAVEQPQEREVVVTGKPTPAPAATPSPVNTASLVSGKVFDENSNPLIGASILIKGSTVGTITDFHGEFQLQLSNECETLIVSYIGMKTRELPNTCGGQALEVAMEKAVVNALPEEVTVVGKASPAVVEGLVIGEGGKPLPGALVLIKDSKIGTVTDMEGVFRLELPEKCATLIFRYVGMVERTLEEVCGGKMAVLLMPEEKAEENTQPGSIADPAVAKFEAYPNPSQGEVNVTFRLEKPGRVKLNVITIDGKLVEKLADQQLDAGPQQFRWQAAPGAKGTFILLLETESGFSRKQVVVE